MHGPFRTSDDFSAWKRIVDDLPYVLWTARPEGGIEYISRHFTRLTGVDAEAAGGTAWLDLVHPDDREAYLAERARSNRTQTAFRSRARLRLEDGSYRWFESFAEPVRDERGTLLRWFGSSVDIDDLVKAERAVAAQNERSEMLLARWRKFRDSNIIGLGVADIDGTLVETNAALRAMLGYDDDMPASWLEMTPPGWEAIDARAIEQIRTSGFAAPFEKEYLARDGRRVPVLLGCAALPENPRQVLFYCIDLTEQRRAQTVMRVLAEREWIARVDEPRDAVRQFVDFVVDAGLADIAAVSLREADGTLRIACFAAATPEFGVRLAPFVGRAVPPASPVARAASTGVAELVTLDDAGYESLGDDEFRAIARSLEVGSLLEVPLPGTSETLGVATLIRRGPSGPFAQYELELAGFVAKRAALALENAELRRVERRSTEQWELLAQEAEALTGSLEFDEIARDVARRIVPRVADAATIHIANEFGRFRTAATAHRDAALDTEMQKWHGALLREPVRATIVDVLHSKRALALDFDEPATPHPRETLDGRPLPLEARVGGRHYVTAPMIARGRVLGVMTCWRVAAERPFENDELLFIEEYARRAALALENALSYERERRVSESFQQAALPASLPLITGARLDAVYVAGGSEATVGGDWYDAVRLLDGRIMLSIGDVAGSGLGAAVAMNAIRQVLRGVALIVPDPDLMLEAADRAVRADGGAYATVLVALYDPIARTLQCASAGHAPPVLRRAGGSIDDVPVALGPPLGLRTGENVERSAGAIALGAGDAVAFYTDGLTEVERDLEAGERRLRDVIRAIDLGASTRPAERLFDELVEDASRDDVAIVVLCVDEPSLEDVAATRRWHLSSLEPERVREIRRHVRELLANARWNRAAIARAELVAGELLANVVRHAPGPIDVVFEAGENPVLHVIDSGPGFRVEPPPARDDLRESGRGLAIVTASTAAFSISPMPGGGSHARAVLLSGRI